MLVSLQNQTKVKYLVRCRSVSPESALIFANAFVKSSPGIFSNSAGKFHNQTYHLFIDYKQAQDRTKRMELYVGMKELGYETKLIRLVKATVDCTKCRVKVQNDLSDEFDVEEGQK